MNPSKSIMEMASTAYTIENCSKIEVKEKLKVRWDCYMAIVKLAAQQLSEMTNIAGEMKDKICESIEN